MYMHKKTKAQKNIINYANNKDSIMEDYVSLLSYLYGPHKPSLSLLSPLSPTPQYTTPNTPTQL
jgi:hypothetical protein